MLLCEHCLEISALDFGGGSGSGDDEDKYEDGNKEAVE